MKCLSCNTEMGHDGKVFNTLLLCSPCYAMAEKAQAEIDVSISRARLLSAQWLEQHILKGGLLRGGGVDVKMEPK